MTWAIVWSINKLGNLVHVIFDGKNNSGAASWAHMVLGEKEWEQFKKDASKV